MYIHFARPLGHTFLCKEVHYNNTFCTAFRAHISLQTVHYDNTLAYLPSLSELPTMSDRNKRFYHYIQIIASREFNKSCSIYIIINKKSVTLRQHKRYEGLKGSLKNLCRTSLAAQNSFQPNRQKCFHFQLIYHE